jgi:hypothetical protein
MLLKEVIVVYSENHAEPINTNFRVSDHKSSWYTAIIWLKSVNSPCRVPFENKSMLFSIMNFVFHWSPCMLETWIDEIDGHRTTVWMSTYQSPV